MAHQPRYESFPLSLYNSLTRRVVRFDALAPPLVGMYVCGPTVYSDPHLGHARSAVAFDTVFRVLRFFGYRVRYVRNITDVGHLEDEVGGSGEDKIARRAAIERVEPMEVVQRYTVSYQDGMRMLGCLPPSIEPRATGHIIEQIQVIERIMDAGLAYEADGSVYFDLASYVADSSRGGTPYGGLSGRVFEELLANTRDTAGAEQKRSGLDFALWKRAEAGHIMRWPSPWGEGFPGWHIECTTMSTRYLGEQFDIHGGGLDLQFPHHEAEIAQNHGAFGADPARYWMHSNMLTVDGQKMAKSLGNFITLEEMFSGNHGALAQAYTPMVVRFFMLQSHYRSTIDFSNEALQAAERGYTRLIDALEVAEATLRAHDGAEAPSGEDAAASPAPGAMSRPPVGPVRDPIAEAGAATPLPDELAALPGAAEHAAVVDTARELWQAIASDFHTPRAIAALFELGRAIRDGRLAAAPGEFSAAVARIYRACVRDVLGLAPEHAAGGGSDELDRVVAILIEMRAEARAAKDFARADAIRDRLAEAGIQLEDRRDGTTGWTHH